ncbi:hypothetical protein IX51_09320 [uncultured archaeon]|nr:hypothetical protein IX51_09320 [uncultured archaeon]
MHGKALISLIYSVSRVGSSAGTGLGEYSKRLLKGLESIGVAIEPIEVTKREYSIAGKPMLGNLSLVVGTRIKRPAGNIVHSLSPEVIHPRTNVLTVHDIIPLKLKEMFSGTYYRERGNKMIFDKINRIEHIISFTQSGKKDLVEIAGANKDRIDVVNQSIDHQAFYRDPNSTLWEEGKKHILTVGDLNPRKRYDLLFRAIGGDEQYQVLHVGPVNAWGTRRDELRSLIKDKSNVRMVGPVEQGVLRQYMSSADLLVHLSEAEGFGYTSIEAMACGTNVLVNDLEVFKETLGNKGFFTKLEEDAIRVDIEKAMGNLHKPSNLIEFSRQYSIERMAESTVEVYRKVDPSIMKQQ